ncbi:cytidylyltransferase domain-containing protein [Evansella halocellulosilytica]|uniref:cytidylyltransferase domain-containing protein n=1 Tax=Evansella halocellulosilytica TaxID=2011013 RepID=UPI000BB71D20|nr:hypothetical protein [Evansella halocellulosilytica]
MTGSGKVAIVVSCRRGSSRLPNKALKQIHGISSIERCLINCKAATKPDFIVLATTKNQEDRVLKNIADSNQVKFFQGAEQDVLTRYIEAAHTYQIQTIARVTGDSPVVSYELIDNLVDEHLSNQAEYTYVENSAIGIASEVMDVAAMERLKQLTSTSMSEYMTYYFKWNPTYVRIHQAKLPVEMRHPDIRITLDEEDDLILLNKIFRFYNKGREAISWGEIEQYFRRFPEDKKLNNFIKLTFLENQQLINRIKSACIIKKNSSGE